MQNAEASVWGTCQARSPALVCLAPKQSPQALQSRDVESRVGRQVAKPEAPGVGKRRDKSLRKRQSEKYLLLEAWCGDSQVRAVAQPR